MITPEVLKQQLKQVKIELDTMKVEQLATGKYRLSQIKAKQSEFIRLSNKHQKLVLGY